MLEKIEDTEPKVLVISNSLSKHQERLIAELKEFKGAIMTMGVSAQVAAKALEELGKTDFSQLEKCVVDSFAYPYIEESAPISKKEWKKLSKKIKRQLNIEPQTQAEIWGNKWDKKIKRNL